MKKSLFIMLAAITINSGIKSAGIMMSKPDSLKTALAQKYNQTFIAPEIRSGNFASIYSKKIDDSGWLKALEDIENYISPSVDIAGYYRGGIKLLKSTSQDLVKIINKGMDYNKNSLKEVSALDLKISNQLNEWRKLEADFKRNYSIGKPVDSDVFAKKIYLDLLINAAQLLSNSGPDSKYAGYPGGLIYILKSALKEMPSLQNDDLTSKTIRIKPKFVSVRDSLKKVIES